MSFAVANALFIGGAAVAWMVYGFYRRKARWAIEGAILLLIVIYNTISFLR